MALTDREILKNAQAGMVGSSGMAADPMTTVKAQHTRVYTINVTDAATAGTAVTESNVFVAPFACRVLSCKVVAPIAVTAAASNIATFNVARERAAVSTSIATGSTVTAGTPGTLAAFVPGSLTLSATSANLDLVAGDVVTFAVVKGSSGVAITAATSTFMCQVTVEENGA